MIYLIDEKKPRQELDYGWNSRKLEKCINILTPLYTYEAMKVTHVREAIFSKGNIILFHESFFDNTVNTHNKDSVDIRADLSKYAAEKNGWVVFFSGSKSSRRLNDRVAHIPVSVLYENLEDFIEKVAESTIDLRYLMYGGKNPEIEEALLIRLMEANQRFDETPLISNRKNLLALTGNRINIPIILESAIEKIFIFEEKHDKEITDLYLNDKIIQWLSCDEVDNIFIPLCFGSSLSDYSGLQFACHIRCTDTINRLKPIFIYSFVDYSFLLDNEYFNVLKTKNIFLIDYTRVAFNDALLNGFEHLIIEELSKEIRKLKLDAPKNYEDSHSISNEWAIYRWAISVQTSDAEIEKITLKIKSQLYFKYLQTIYPKSEDQLLKENQLKIKFTGSPKILYIDDEAGKGWFEIFCKMLCDINKLDFHLLDDEFNSKSQEEIINISINKILEKDIDLVLLDFRLHEDDFNTSNIQNITGLKILKEIKRKNPGIQVIIFSATNKIWNLQALQEAGADGFIIKESPENSADPTYTFKSITNYITVLNRNLKRVFLKDIFKNLETIEESLKRIEEVPENKKFNDFVKKLRKQLVVILTSARNINLEKPVTLDVVFLSYYTLLDLFKKYYLNNGNDYRYYLGFERIELMRYKIENNTINQAVPFIPEEHYEKPGIYHVYSGLLKDYFLVPQIYDTNEFIINFNKIRDYRNEYIHGTKQQFTKEELTLIINSLLPITSNIRE